MQAFTDLVGTSAVPAHCFDSTELTDLTPALDPATAVHDMAAQASEAILGGAVVTYTCFPHTPYCN